MVIKKGLMEKTLDIPPPPPPETTNADDAGRAVSCCVKKDGACIVRVGKMNLWRWNEGQERLIACR